MTLSDEQIAFARDVAVLILYIEEKGYGCTLGEAWRTKEMAEIYAKQGKGIKASAHCKRLAIDLNLFLGGKYLTSCEAHRPFGEYWEALDPKNRWGGRFPRKDGNHYERKP